jgi:hypothetical protein
MDLKILQLLLFGRNQRHEVSRHDPRWTSAGRTVEDACTLASGSMKFRSRGPDSDLLEHMLVSIPIGLASSIPTQLEDARTLQFYAV